MNEPQQDSRRAAADAFNESLEQLQSLLKLSDLTDSEFENKKDTEFSETNAEEWEEILADLEKLNQSKDEPE